MGGHFGRLCQNEAVKSAKSKQRDSDRMANFIRRKTAESIFPFQNEELQVILDQTFNSNSSYMYQDLQQMISELMNESNQRAYEIMHLTSESRKLKSEFANEANKLAEKNEELTKELSNSCSANRDQLHRLNNDLFQSNSKIFTYKIRIQDLSNEIQTLKSKNEGLEQNQQFNLERMNKIPLLDDRASYLEMVIDQLLQELHDCTQGTYEFIPHYEGFGCYNHDNI